MAFPPHNTGQSAFSMLRLGKKTHTQKSGMQFSPIKALIMKLNGWEQGGK